MNWKQNTTGRGARALILALVVVLAVAPAMAPAMAQTAAQQADIQIEQPRHVSQSVDTINENGTRVYTARGAYLELRPQNFNTSDVSKFVVQESEGILTYDKGTGEYVLDTQGNAGTYHVKWTVSAENSTVLYQATIRVVTASYAHLPQSQYSQLKADARKGDELRQSIADSGDPDKSVDEKVEFGNRVRNFANNPFSVLTGQFIALQTLRFLTPAGWLDLGMILALVYGLTRGLYSTIARLRKQLEKEEQVSRREDIQRLKQYKSVLAGQQMTEVDAIDDHQAAVLETSLGTNMFTALRNFWNTWGAGNLKRMYLDAMGAVGYRARVTRDDRGEVTAVEILDPEDGGALTDGGEPSGDLTPLKNAPEDVVGALSWEQVDTRVFQRDPDISAVDHLMVQNRDSDADLIGDLNVSIPEDFQSRQEFMEAIAAFLQHVQETEFTDDENYPRKDRTVLNHLFAFTTVMEQEYNVPLDLYWRACIWNADGLDRDDEARDVLSDITDAEQMLDDTDLPGGGHAPN